MTTRRPSRGEIEAARGQTDRHRLDELGDAEIDRAIAEAPDAAPDLADALRHGAFRSVDPTSEAASVESPEK